MIRPILFEMSPKYVNEIYCFAFVFAIGNSILSIKNGKDCLPIEDNCLEEERSDDSNCCLRSVILHVRDAYNVFCTIKPKF